LRTRAEDARARDWMLRHVLAARGGHAAVAPHGGRALTIGSGDMGASWKDRERAAEELYFSKSDAAALASLAEKMRAHAAPSVEKVTMEKEALAAIFDKHGVKATSGLLDDVRSPSFAQKAACGRGVVLA
jgi:hypothetical protein